MLFYSKITACHPTAANHPTTTNHPSVRYLPQQRQTPPRRPPSQAPETSSKTTLFVRHLPRQGLMPGISRRHARSLLRGAAIVTANAFKCPASAAARTDALSVRRRKRQKPPPRCRHRHSEHLKLSGICRSKGGRFISVRRRKRQKPPP